MVGNESLLLWSFIFLEEIVVCFHNMNNLNGTCNIRVTWTKPRKSANTFYFEDDLWKHILWIWKKIKELYLSELVLKKEKYTSSFLDLDINATSLRLSYKIQEMHFFSLPFSIVRMPYKDSNMLTSNRYFYAAV